MKSISLKLSAALLSELDREAKRRRKSKSEVVRLAISQYLRARPQGKKAVSALDRAGDLVGCADGPTDLSTNPKHFDGFGS